MNGYNDKQFASQVFDSWNQEATPTEPDPDKKFGEYNNEYISEKLHKAQSGVNFTLDSMKHYPAWIQGREEHPVREEIKVSIKQLQIILDHMTTADLKARQITRVVDIENASGGLISRKEELIHEHARHWLEPDEEGESIESGIILFDGERIVANLDRINGKERWVAIVQWIPN